MKYLTQTCFVLFLLLTFYSQVHAQIPVPFPTENASWQEGYFIAPNSPIPQQHVLCGDTLINGTSYATIRKVNFDNQGNQVLEGYQGALRNVPNRVLWIPKDKTSEEVLYDFSLESTEQITLNTVLGTENTITAKSNQFLTTPDGMMRRVIVFASQSGAPEEVWIEGIGSSLGLLARGTDQNAQADYQPFLNCFRSANEIQYEHPMPPLTCDFVFNQSCEEVTDLNNLENEEFEISIFPNPFWGNINLEISDFEKMKKPKLRIYNGQGQLILQQLILGNSTRIVFPKKVTNGIYILEVSTNNSSFPIRKKIVKL